MHPSSSSADANAYANIFTSTINNNTTTTTTVPTISSEQHRRVDVETIDDLRALVDAARRAGQEKIDLCLPRLDGANDGGVVGADGRVSEMRGTGENETDAGTDELRSMVEKALRGVSTCSSFVSLMFWTFQFLFVKE